MNASILKSTRPETEGTLIADKIRTFLKDEIIPYEKDSRIGFHGPSDELVTELRGKAKKAGLLTPHLKADGTWLPHKDIAVVFRATGYSTLGPVALNVMAPDEGNMYLLSKIATPQQKEKFLEPLLQGDTRSAFFMTEPNEDGGAGSDPSMLKTTATPHGDGWVINGRKAFITGVEGAQVAIIMAKTSEAATMFLVELPNQAVQVERVIDTIDNSMPGGHAYVSITNLHVNQENVLGEVDLGFKYAQVRLAPARLTHCMRWLGACERAHDIASAYATRRQAFGKPIIDHEGVGFMLADNLIDLKQSELLIDWCAEILDQGDSSASTESSVAKVAVSEALFKIADRCVQVLGGTGVSQDTVVEQVFREVRAFRIYDGPSEVHRWSLAKKIKRSTKQ